MREGMPTPESLHDLKKVVSPEKEKGEPLHRVAAEAVWNWVAALQKRFEKKGRESWKSLSLSERLGAAAVPAMFLTLIQGCTTQYKELECTTDDQAYQDSIIKWAQDHPAEIQTEMDKLWGDDAKVTAKQVIDTLAGADLRCGVAVSNPHADLGLETGASAYPDLNKIVVNVGSEPYQGSLQLFTYGEDTADWSQEFIQSMEVAENFDESSAVRQYDFAIVNGMEILIHESGHLTLDAIHGLGASKKLADAHAQADIQMVAVNTAPEDHSSEEIDSTYATINSNMEAQISEIDRVYGWGEAGKRAAEAWSTERESGMNHD